MPIGRLTKNAQRQPPADTMAAPSDGPVATASAPTPPHNATICVRRSGGYALMSRATDAGTKKAAPAPCTMRLTTSKTTFGAMPHRNEPHRNTARPAVNIPRRPTRAPVRPPGTRSAPNTIEEPGITHAHDAWLACGYDASRSGKATFTMDRSSAAMKAPTAVTANTTDGRGPSPAITMSALDCSSVSCVIELTFGRAYAATHAEISAGEPLQG